MATRKLNKAQLIQLLETMSANKRDVRRTFAKFGYDDSVAYYSGELNAIDRILGIIKDDAVAVEMWDLYCGKEQTA